MNFIQRYSRDGGFAIRGILVAVIALNILFGGYAFILNEWERYPLYLLTHPAWAMCLFLFLYPRINVMPIITGLMLLSLPQVSVVCYQVVDWLIDFIVPHDSGYRFNHLSDLVLSNAYAPLWEQLDYWSIGRHYAGAPDYGMFISFLNIAMLFGWLFFYGLLPQEAIESLAADRDIEFSYGLHYMVIRLLTMGGFFYIAFPLFEFTTDLPLGVQQLTLWTLLLIPLYGTSLSTFNWANTAKDKVAKGAILFGALVLGGITLYYTALHTRELAQALVALTQGDWLQARPLLYLGSLLFVAYMLFGLMYTPKGEGPVIADQRAA
ncbi:hypothetical protein Maes01_00238 [Microbulbifer aestuariivivens]|uniref:DUF1361 domain-containing protein n=1 Tax=Microbulbifer aestuariivivens TaxID=1908308 RepID=A0ABP9WL16_9GAMM